MVSTRPIDNLSILQSRPNQQGFLNRHKVITAIALIAITALVIGFYQSQQCHYYWNCPHPARPCSNQIELSWCEKMGMPLPVDGAPWCICPGK
jgi:hypothetical protein